jgi:hypothetical protein
MNSLTMQENLMQKLLLYITENNPDLLFRLEEEETVSNYLLDKVTSVSSIINDAARPDYLKEEICMSVITQSLRPSKFNYICRVLEEEFEATYWQLKRSGTLKYEAVSLVMYCQPLFEAVHFSEANEENRLLYYAVAGAVVEYFDKDVSEREVLSNGVQQPTEA